MSERQSFRNIQVPRQMYDWLKEKGEPEEHFISIIRSRVESDKKLVQG
ncbi:MAG TPA: hypothetical protein VMY59_01100 [Candidatus Thermoplasmatota archaeon]|nr:hypothetical protein [Candidatus Thermoplasmatota archaeon]